MLRVIPKESVFLLGLLPTLSFETGKIQKGGREAFKIIKLLI